MARAPVTSGVNASSIGAKIVKPPWVNSSSCCAPPAASRAFWNADRPSVDREVVARPRAWDNFGGVGRTCYQPLTRSGSGVFPRAVAMSGD